MVFFEWNNSYSVGIPSIDDQHRKLFELVNSLYASMKEGKTAEIIGGVLNDLANYAVYHFREEEALMKRVNYADFSAHKKEHDAFILKVSEDKQKFDDGKQSFIGLDLAKFLKEWLMNHIAGTDKKYSQDLQKAGIK